MQHLHVACTYAMQKDSLMRNVCMYVQPSTCECIVYTNECMYACILYNLIDIYIYVYVGITDRKVMT